MTDTPAILNNVETFLAQQYDTRHVPSAPVVKRRTWFDVVGAWLREWLADLIELLIRMEEQS